MNLIFNILSWIFGLFFFLLFALSIWAGNVIPSIPVLLIIILLIPPLRVGLTRLIHLPLPVWLRSILIPVPFILFIFLLFKTMGNPESIYKTPDIEQKLMTIYDERMNEWPVPYESEYIPTSYGKVFVVISGPEDAPPLMLLHASAMANWSWLYNVEGLNRYFRTYAIDTMGDAGRSVLADINTYPTDGPALAKFYSEIMDSLGIEKASFMGASQGGFISTNVALYAPDRVDKLILCGPMGYSGTTSSVLRILFTTMFPVKPIQQSATLWAFGNDPRMQEIVSEWFELILKGVISRQARPMPFSQSQLESISQPVLLIFGSRDGLVGNPENAREHVKNIQNIRVEVLDTGHLISAEKPEAFNELVIGFLGSDTL